TGPLHVAALVGTPVVQLLGPTDPVENAPWPETASRVVRERLRGEAEERGGAAAPAVDDALVARVVAAARELLAAAPAPAPGAGRRVAGPRAAPLRAGPGPRGRGRHAARRGGARPTRARPLDRGRQLGHARARLPLPRERAARDRGLRAAPRLRADPRRQRLA